MIRAALARDIGSLAVVDADCFGADAWSRNSWEAEVEARRVTVTTGEIRGVCVTRCVAEDAEILRVAVLPLHRGQGIARSLLEAALKDADSRGCTRMFLEVEADNAAALALYRSLGFDLLSRRRNYYGIGRDALVMSRDVVTDG